MHQFKIDQKNKTEEMAEALSRYVNSVMASELPKLGIAMCRDHRTLIQLKMRFVMAFLGELSDMKAHGQYDARNEAACNAADKMLAALDFHEKAMPFI